MITTEIMEMGGKQFARTISDKYYIKKVGTNEVYEEANDLHPSAYTYEETEQELPEEVVEERKKRKEQ
jgi:hypothetical protein